jgi:putative holliday junction resolvase
MHDLTGRAPFNSSPHFFVAVIPMIDGVVLGFDFGARRIGVAIGNTLTREARPLTTIEAVQNSMRWREIGALVAQWEPQGLVVGIPRHPDGTAHAMTARCERFAHQLEGRYQLPVDRVDERYSSAVVQGADDVDAAAAAIILQQWFEADA